MWLLADHGFGQDSPKKFCDNLPTEQKWSGAIEVSSLVAGNPWNSFGSQKLQHFKLWNSFLSTFSLPFEVHSVQKLELSFWTSWETILKYSGLVYCKSYECTYKFLNFLDLYFQSSEYYCKSVSNLFHVKANIIHK